MVASLKEKLRELRIVQNQPVSNVVNPKWLAMREPEHKGGNTESQYEPVIPKGKFNTKKPKPVPLDRPVNSFVMLLSGWQMDQSRDATGRLTAALPLGYVPREES